MPCIASLTGKVGTETITAFATADISPDGSCITFTLTNTTPSNPDGSSPLIDQFFFNLNADFLTTLITSTSAFPAWTFASDQTAVTPRDCGIFNYKFGTNDVALKLNNGLQSTGVFSICSAPGTFSTATLNGVRVCARFQNVLGGGLGSGTSGCACGTWNCGGTTTTTSTTSTSTTSTTSTSTTSTSTSTTSTSTTSTSTSTTTTTTSTTSTTSTTTPPPKVCPLVQPVANMEQALANTLNVVLASGDVVAIQNVLKLIIKKEMLLEFLLEECPNLGFDCSNC